MSKKHAYYFPHFLNARNDSKILKLRRVLGLEGYAIYFMLLEVLREQSDRKYPLSGLTELEFDFRIAREKIATIIHDYGLFEVDDNCNFFSKKLDEYMQPFEEKYERARLAANKKWELERQKTSDAKGDANASNSANAYPNADAKALPEGMQKHTFSDAKADANKEINKEINKERKVEKLPPANLSESNLFRQPKIPKFEEVHRVFLQHGGTEEMAKKFFETNNSVGWFFKGSPVTDFSSQVPGYIRSWNRNDNKNGHQKEQPLLGGRKILSPR